MDLLNRIIGAWRRSRETREQREDEAAVEGALLERESAERARRGDPHIPPARSNDSTYINLGGGSGS